LGTVTAMTAFDTPGPIAVELALGVGDIRITASNRADTIVDVRPGNPADEGDVAAAEQTRVEYAGGRLLVQAPGGWKQWLPWRGGESIVVEIQLPAGSDLRGEAAIAPLRCSGPLGECRYETSLGDIQIERAGPVWLKTVGAITVGHAAVRAEVSSGTGAVRIARVDGAAMVRNKNGDSWIGEAGGELQVTAANGAITVDGASASVTAKTANGDIRLGEVARGVIVAQSGHGRIDVGVRDGVAAWLDLDTGFGTVHSDLGAARGPEPGEDTVEIRANTAFGDITISRRVATGIGKDDL
jgi:hypothetical protein